MEKYTIYCTEKQTKKALKLGAPIHVTPIVDFFRDEIGKSFFLNDGDACWFPTAEQMICWLEEQKLGIDIVKDFGGCEWSVWVEHTECYYDKVSDGFVDAHSRKEATLAAIDAALEYLVKTKEEKQ